MDSADHAPLNKYDCLDRAKRQLAAGDPAALRYACLELRFCLEAVTYEMLRSYASRLPQDVLSHWQPPQALAALLELEGEADEEYTIAVGLQQGDSRGPLEGMGEHRTFTRSWLRKHYNKLGSFLHVPNENRPGGSGQTMTLYGLREYLDVVVNECERVVDSSITFALAPIVAFTCQVCRREIVVNAEGAKHRGRVSCLHAECAADHTVSMTEDGSLCFRLQGDIFPCQDCGHRKLVPSTLQTEGYEFSCDRCGRRHKLFDRVWRYAAEIDPSATGDSDRR